MSQLKRLYCPDTLVNPDTYLGCTSNTTWLGGQIRTEQKAARRLQILLHILPIQLRVSEPTIEYKIQPSMYHHIFLLVGLFNFAWLSCALTEDTSTSIAFFLGGYNSRTRRNSKTRTFTPFVRTLESYKFWNYCIENQNFGTYPNQSNLTLPTNLL